MIEWADCQCPTSTSVGANTLLFARQCNTLMFECQVIGMTVGKVITMTLTERVSKLNKARDTQEPLAEPQVPSEVSPSFSSEDANTLARYASLLPGTRLADTFNLLERFNTVLEPSLGLSRLLENTSGLHAFGLFSNGHSSSLYPAITQSLMQAGGSYETPWERYRTQIEEIATARRCTCPCSCGARRESTYDI